MNRKEVVYIFHHMGIPTQQKREGERYSTPFKMYTSGGENSEFRIQYHRFEEDSPLHPLIKTMPHIAFKVSDIEKATEGREILLEPYNPFEGFRVAIVKISGAPVEFIETNLTEEEIWGIPKGKSYIYPEGIASSS